MGFYYLLFILYMYTHTPTHSYAYLWISEEEAKKKIYNVSCERYFGFGCELDEETSNKLEGIFFINLIDLIN